MGGYLEPLEPSLSLILDSDVTLQRFNIVIQLVGGSHSSAVGVGGSYLHDQRGSSGRSCFSLQSRLGSFGTVNQPEVACRGVSAL